MFEAHRRENHQCIGNEDLEAMFGDVPLEDSKDGTGYTLGKNQSKEKIMNQLYTDREHGKVDQAIGTKYIGIKIIGNQYPNHKN